MFDKGYLPDHSFKSIYRFKFSEFPIKLLTNPFKHTLVYF